MNTDSDGREISSIVIGALLCIVTPLVIIPQIIKLFRARSSAGISFFTFGIATFNTWAALLNALLLNANALAGCGIDPLKTCVNALLVCTQLLSMFVGYLFTLSACMIFYWNNPSEWRMGEFYRIFEEPLKKTDATVVDNHPNADDLKGWRVRRCCSPTFGYVSLITLMSCFGFSGYTLWKSYPPYASLAYGESMGAISTCFMFVQWVPQIVQTYRSKSVGGLSVPMLLLGAPGSFFMVFYLSVLSRQALSTWVPYAFSFLQQATLLALCCYYENFRSAQDPVLPQ
jgi:uncharacterized protein with PQ loop repeat